MKKAIAIIILGLLVCSNANAAVNKNFLKGKFKCSDIDYDVSWTFSFETILNPDGESDFYVKTDNEKATHGGFSRWRDGHRLLWFKTIDDGYTQDLEAHSLTLSKSTKNYSLHSLGVFEDNEGLSKADFERLHELFVKADKEKKKNFSGKKHIEYEHAFFDSAYKIIFAEDLNRENLLLLRFANCRFDLKSMQKKKQEE